MGPGQEDASSSLFSPSMESIYTKLASKLAANGLAVCHFTWRSPPMRPGASRELLRMPATLRDGASDVAAVAAYMRTSHEADNMHPSLPLLLIGFCFGVPASLAAAARALNGEPAFSKAVSPLAGVIGLSLALRVDDSTRSYGGYDSLSCALALSKASVPLLVLHGTHDTVIDATSAETLFEASPGPKSAAWMLDAAHQLTGRSFDVIALLMAWATALFRRYDIAGQLGFQLEAPPLEGLNLGHAQTL
jgi:fermentation-respiration switch protein FrsA (DUF1100 family)